MSQEISDEEAQRIYEELEREFGDNLPDFIHHPRQFEYYIKLYMFKKELERHKNK